MKAPPITPKEATSPDKVVSFPFQMGVVAPLKQIEDNYKTLKDSLKAGNIAKAQASFAALQQSKKTAVANGTIEATVSNSPLGAHFASLQNALQGGDLSTAQKAFNAVDQILEKAYAASVLPGESPAVKSATASQASNSPLTEEPVAEHVGNILNAKA